MNRGRFSSVIKLIVGISAILLLLYLMLFTEFFTVFKYNIIYRANAEAFWESAEALLTEDDTRIIWLNDEKTEGYDSLKGIGVEIIEIDSDGIYFQLWSNRKVGRGVVYKTDKGFNGTVDWVYKINESWYVYQEH